MHHANFETTSTKAAFSSMLDGPKGGQTMTPPGFNLEATVDHPPAQADTGPGDVLTGFDPLTMASPDPASSFQASNAPLQRKGDEKKPAPEKFIAFNIQVEKEMSREAFLEKAEQELLGADELVVHWKNIKDTYSPGEYRLKIAASLVMKARKINNARREIPTAENGQVKGAKERLATLKDTLDKSRKDSISNEIGRRYHAATGGEKKKDWKPNASEKAFRKHLRDEVLYQFDYLKNLPDSFSELVQSDFSSPDGDMKDLESWYGLAKRLEKLSPDQLKAFREEQEGKVQTLEWVEKSLDGYLLKVGEQKAENQKREEVQANLYGLGDVYKLYRQYQENEALKIPSNVLGSAQAGYAKGRRKKALLDQIEPALKAHGFEGGVEEFGAQVEAFRSQFESSALNMTMEYLDRYQKMLSKESSRYQDPKLLQDLHQKLAPFRKQRKDYRKKKESRDMQLLSYPMGSPLGQGYAKTYREKIDQANQAVNEAKGKSEAELEGLGKNNPIFRESHLSEDRRIPRNQLANADNKELESVLKAHIESKQQALEEVRKRLLANPELLYRVEKLHPAFQTAMGFPKGGLCEQIILDRKQKIEDDEFVTQFLLGAAGLVVGLSTMGAGTPLMAGLTAAAGLGISGYMAYEEVAAYSRDANLSEAGMADSPSLGWLMVALVGAGLDVGGITKSLKILGPSAKALGGAEDIAKFRPALRQLQKELGLSDEAIQMIDKAALAKWEAKRQGQKLQEFLVQKGTGIGQGGQEVDQLVKEFARAKFKEGYSSYEAYAGELEQLLEMKGLKKMDAAALKKTKAAWLKVRKDIESVRDNFLARGESHRFKLTYSDQEILDLLSRGEELGLSRKTIEDFIFVGSKFDKGRSAAEMMQQMGNFKEVIEPRGYPYLFKGRAQFETFKSKVNDLCEEFGLPTGDIRMQGSSLRTPKAKDIDVVVVLNQKEFDVLLARIRNHRQELLSGTKSPEHLKKMKKFNKGFHRKMDKQLKHGKLSDFQIGRLNGGEDIFRSRLYKILHSIEGCPKDIDFSIMSPKGKLNIAPFLNFK